VKRQKNVRVRNEKKEGICGGFYTRRNERRRKGGRGEETVEIS